MAWFSGDAPHREPTLQEMLGAFMATITQANVDANTRGAINAQRTTDMMQFMMQQSQQMHAQMAQGLQSMAESQGSGGSGDTASHGTLQSPETEEGHDQDYSRDRQDTHE